MFRHLISLLSFRNILLYFTPIIYWGMYEYVGITESIPKLICFVYTLFLLAFLFKSVFVIKYSTQSYSFYIKTYIILLFISMLMSWIFLGQGLSLSYRASAWGFIFLYYFLLKRFRVGQEEVYRLVVLFTIVYAVLWGIALLSAPEIIFSRDERLIDDRGVFRIVIRSFDVVSLAFFCFLVRSCCKGKGRMLYILFAVLSFALVFLGLSRMIIVGTLLVTCFYLYGQLSHSKKIVLVVLVFFALVSTLIFQPPKLFKGSDDSIVEAMIDMTQEQFSSVDLDNSDLRLIEYKIGFIDYPRNPITFLFGCGTPHPESSYGKYERSLRDKYKFDRADAGYPAIFVTHGLLGLFLIISLFIKAGRQKTSKGSDSYRLYMVFIAFINLMQEAIVWYGIAICLAVYCLELDRMSRKKFKTNII